MRLFAAASLTFFLWTSFWALGLAFGAVTYDSAKFSDAKDKVLDALRAQRDASPAKPPALERGLGLHPVKAFWIWVIGEAALLGFWSCVWLGVEARQPVAAFEQDLERKKAALRAGQDPVA